MVAILFSKILAIAVLILTGFVFYKIFKSDTNDYKPFLVVNILGALVAPGALIATAMMSAQGTTLSVSILFYTCLAGIPLVIICLLLHLIYSVIIKDVSKGVLVLKIPVLYGIAWICLAMLLAVFAS